MDLTDSDLMPSAGPRFSTPAVDTARSIAPDFSNRHTSATTFTPPAELAYAQIHSERPRWYTPEFSQSEGPGGPHPHGLEGVSQALGKTTGDQARKSEQKDRERERRQAKWGSQRPMEQSRPEPSYGGHQFPGPAENEPFNEAAEESPAMRFGSREEGWGGGFGLGGSRWND
jgi:hypothetical protein